jgi:hypothetical protein
MAIESVVSSVITVPFWLVTSDGTSPDTGASGDSLILYAAASGATFTPDLQIGAVHAAAGQYRAVLPASATSAPGPLWGYHTQGAFAMPVFALNLHLGSLSTFAASTDSVGLKGVNHPGATIPTVTTLTGHTAQTGDAFARLGAPAGASHAADIAAIKTQTAAIETDTGTDLPATLSTINTKLDTIDDLLDTEIAAILEDTGTTLDDLIDTEIGAIKTKTDSLTFTVAGQVDANIQSINDTALTGDGANGTEWGPA